MTEFDRYIVDLLSMIIIGNTNTKHYVGYRNEDQHPICYQQELCRRIFSKADTSDPRNINHIIHTNKAKAALIVSWLHVATKIGYKCLIVIAVGVNGGQLVLIIVVKGFVIEVWWAHSIEEIVLGESVAQLSATTKTGVVYFLLSCNVCSNNTNRLGFVCRRSSSGTSN